MTLGLSLIGTGTFIGVLIWFCLRKPCFVKAGAKETAQRPYNTKETALAVLIPLTDEARMASSNKPIKIARYPFRVGRESRVCVKPYSGNINERQKSNSAPSNDLYLLDTFSNKLHISRAHFQIETLPEGGYDLVDRESACGTLVGKKNIGGGDKGGRCTLISGDIITIGTKLSPYIFRFMVEEKSVDDSNRS